MSESSRSHILPQGELGLELVAELVGSRLLNLTWLFIDGHVLEVRHAVLGDWHRVRPIGHADAGIILSYSLIADHPLLKVGERNPRLVRWGMIDAVRPVVYCPTCDGSGRKADLTSLCAGCDGLGTIVPAAWAASEPKPGTLLPDDPF